MKFSRITIRTTPTGNSVSIPVYSFKGKNPKAKKAYIQSSVHGAELQGNAVIHSLIEYFKKNPPEGDVTLVPLANPVATDRKTGEYTDGRFDTVTGENWNRAYLDIDFTSFKGARTIDAIKAFMKSTIKKRLARGKIRFAEKLALTLQQMAVEADLVLDLHNANVSNPYVYASETKVNDAAYFGFFAVIAIPATFGGAMDEAISATWVKLADKMMLDKNEIPHGYTLELGGQEQLSLKDGAEQAAGIIEFLKHSSVVAGKARKPKAARVGELKDYIIVFSPQGGLYDYAHEVGTVAKKGTVLARCLNFTEDGGVVTEVKAEQDFLPTLHYSSAAVSEGDELFRGFLKWQNLSVK